MEKNSHPLVAIKCFVYNHEPYLRECLDGFVMQQTDFPFVAIVHDDASTDHSADIIREYAAKYPDIIHPIYETENQYSKQDGSLGRIMDAAIDSTGAKYIAMCEGDDYWTDPNKLQKQVDFLEEHLDYSMCFHGADILNESHREIFPKCETIENREYFPDDVYPDWVVPTASIVYRNIAIKEYPLVHQEWIVAGDIVLIMKCMHRGRVFAFSDHMSVYRMNDGSVMAKLDNVECPRRMALHNEFLLLNFPLINKDACKYLICSYYYYRFTRRDGMRSPLWYLYKSFSISPRTTGLLVNKGIKRVLGKFVM
mgnify:CR=1 FL=1